jgi:TetR/AcrR family transcriptional repressor of nem operon
MKAIRRRSASVSRDRILQEAEHLIHLRGYHCTSLDDIAVRCRMTKANLLHHFKSKEALGLAVLDYKIDAYRRCCLDPIFSNGADPVEAVRQLFAWAGRFHQGNGCRAGCFVGNIALEMSDSSERFREKAEAFFTEWVDRIAEALSRRTAGRFAPGTSPQSTAEAILSLYEGAMMLARTRRDYRVMDRAGRVAMGLARASAKVNHKFGKNRATGG